MTNKIIWSQVGSTFMPGDSSLNRVILDPGIYEYTATPQSWFIERKRAKFEFPFKIYGESDEVINHVKKAWGNLEGNLGVLLNGLRGSGKTVSAQLLCNWAIENKMPVVVVDRPIDLAEVLLYIQQDCVVVFDEFEKTHSKQEHQQDLLSTIDGMSRSLHRRLFLFVTNEKKIDPNLVDRPTRIRYFWEFGRLSDAVIKELIDDLLRPEMKYLTGSILRYLNTRKVCSIDVVKAVITEVNIFERDPEIYAKNMNLSEVEVSSFVLEVLHEDGRVEPVTSYFVPENKNKLYALLSDEGVKDYIESYEAKGSYLNFGERDGALSFCIGNLKSTDDPFIWETFLYLPTVLTWFGKNKEMCEDYYNNRVVYEAQPKDWVVPEWFKAPKTKTQKKDFENEMQDFVYKNTLYGGPAKKCKIRITPNMSSNQISLQEAMKAI